jgi:hypothetical protein
MRDRVGGRSYHAPTLLGAEDVKQVFWALGGEHSHNL